MENNAGIEPQNNSRKTLTIVLISLLSRMYGCSASSARAS